MTDRPPPTLRQVSPLVDEFGATHAAQEQAGVNPRERYARVRAEARALAPGHLGTLLWLDARCQRLGMHPLDPWWVARFGEFYDSRKPIMVCRKGLRAGGSASACRSLTNDTLFTERDLDSGTIGVIPIMSSSRDEATDRFFTIRKILRACGMAPTKGDDEEALDVLPGGVGGEYKSTKSLAGGGVIQLQDSQGHKLELRVLPAIRRAAVGYTGVGGFLDESDLWPNDPDLHVNPAGQVIRDVMKRFTTQPTARLYIFSASYHAKSAHSERVDKGDTSAQFLARLGVDGARIDTEARRWLAAKIGSEDPRLLAEADPRSPDIPAWVTAAPVSPIDRCHQMSDLEIGPMLALYGGRAAENVPEGGLATFAGVEFPRASAAARDALADIVIAVAPPIDGSEWGILVLGVTTRGDDGLGVVLADESGSFSGGEAAARICELAARWSILFAVAAAPHGVRVRTEIEAHVSGMAIHSPIVAEVAVYDRTVLRCGPVRTLYQRARLAHVAGLQALEGAALAWTPGGERAPRIEALAAGAHHLQLGAWATPGQAWNEPLRAPRLADSMQSGHAPESFQIINRLGGLAARGDIG